jgi:hypothetical protein
MRAAQIEAALVQSALQVGVLTSMQAPRTGNRRLNRLGLTHQLDASRELIGFPSVVPEVTWGLPTVVKRFDP